MDAETVPAPRGSKPLSAAALSGRHDPQARRLLKRSGRERGGWAYIPAEDLLAAGIDPDAPGPYYRTKALPKGRSSVGRVFVQFYKEK